MASLAGPVGGPFWVVLSRITDTGVSVVAGQLKQATSCGVHVFGHAGVEESAAQGSAEQPKPRAAKNDWATQAKAAAPHTAPEPEEEEWPEVGDLVEHFAFGLCDVLMASDDRLKIRDKTGPGRIREIRAEVLRVSPPITKNGKRLFKLERKN